MHIGRSMACAVVMCGALAACGHEEQRTLAKDEAAMLRTERATLRPLVRRAWVNEVAPASPVQTPVSPVTQSGFAFLPPRQYNPIYDSVYLSYTGVVIGDVTGDGRDDLVASTDRGMMEVFVQQADGTLAAPIRFKPGSGPVLGDFNEDDVLDIAYFSYATSEGNFAGHQIKMLLSNGRGGWLDKTSWETTDTGYAIGGFIAMDFDGDAHLDLVAYKDNPPCPGTENMLGGPRCGRYMVMPGDGRGGLGAIEVRQVSIAGGISQLLAHDLNEDGRKDLVITVPGSDPDGSVLVSYSLAGGGMGTDQILHAGQYSYGSLRFMDVNGDGIEDSVMMHGDQHRPVEIRLRALDGSFQAPIGLWSHPPYPLVLWADDFDGDRKTDLVMGQITPDLGAAIAYYRQSGSVLLAPVFTRAPQYLHPASGSIAFASGDLNGDGCKDLVLAAGADGLLFLDGSQCQHAPRVMPNEGGLIWAR